MTVHQVSLWWRVSNHRCVEVGRTPHLGSLTCLVFSWCVSLPLSIGPSCCFLCRSPWRSPSLWCGSERWNGLWLPTCFAHLLRIYWCFVCKPLHHVVWHPVDFPVAVLQKLYLFLQRKFCCSSNEGSSGCWNVNNNEYKGCILMNLSTY